ncbi:MAG: aminotransferase class I/II-fold pyridoxal phosphate-dependent enzyme [Treponema sp.]|nr:aminotransferase class I/II-fold pyridoxal phosphate-dependent enzyme [Treponema sp.]
MSVFWNKRTVNLTPYVPGEQPKDRKFIKLNTNENPYPPSPKVIEAIEQALAITSQGKDSRAKGDKLRLYPDPLCTEFREVVAAAYGVKPSQVFPGNGSDEVLGFVFGAFFETPEKESVTTHSILFPDITYSFYPVYADLWNIPYKTIPIGEDFSINLNDYSAGSGGVIISNPNAPTGRDLPASDLLQLARKLEQNNRVLVVDEAYAVFGAQSLVPHINDHPNLLTVHTLSKSASLAGLRVGFAIGSEELIAGLFRVRDSFNSYTMDALALAGGSAAVLDKSYYETINQKVIATRETTVIGLKAMGFTVIPSKANFLFVTYPGISGQALFQSLRDKGILVRHFNKPRIADYLRVSIGTGEDMDTFLSACRETIELPGN